MKAKRNELARGIIGELGIGGGRPIRFEWIMTLYYKYNPPETGPEKAGWRDAARAKRRRKHRKHRESSAMDKGY